MANIKKPNTVCRNKNCKNGTDGKRKEFFACKYCLRTENWRSFCCCRECFDKYVNDVNKVRNAETSDKLPDRLDMTKDEIKKYMEVPYETAVKETEQELSEYIAENPDKSITEIIEIVNSDIKENSRKKKSNREGAI